MDPRPTVLVVDDEQANRALMSACLTGKYRVLTSEGAASALKILATENVDLLLLDVMMPGMNGLDLCRTVKAQPRADFLPVVLLTALSEQEHRNAGLEAGADDFLSKPVDRRELLLRARGWITIRSQRQIIKQQLEQLQHLEELKDDLVSLLVHDLRNPLASIHGLLAAMSTDTSGASLREDLEAAQRSAEQMRLILDDLLEVRLLEEKRLALRLETNPVWKVVLDALSLMGGAALERDVRLVPSGDREVAIRLDSRLVSRALWNLTMNAVKHSARGATVDVVVGSHPGLVDIDVADRGPGVPAPLRGLLFEKFRTGEQHSEPARRGFGLGLYLVKLVASAHGGGVSVQDREGGGAIFRLSLPVGTSG